MNKNAMEDAARAKRIRLFVSRRLHFKGLSFHYVGGLVQYWCWRVCY